MPQTGSFSIELAWLSCAGHLDCISIRFNNSSYIASARPATHRGLPLRRNDANDCASARVLPTAKPPARKKSAPDIGAIAVFADEALQAADLSLDPPQTLQV